MLKMILIGIALAVIHTLMSKGRHKPEPPSEPEQGHKDFPPRPHI